MKNYYSPKADKIAPKKKKKSKPEEIKGPSKRIRKLYADKFHYKTLPKKLNIFHAAQHQYDRVSKSLLDFCACPSFTYLIPIVNLEIEAWNTFANQPTHIHGRRAYFRRQVDQRSKDRTPDHICEEFLEKSFILRLLHRVVCHPPTHFRSDENPDFGSLFAKLRLMPHFSRNVTHEIITFCNLGNRAYILARRAQRHLANTSWKTYKSALDQLAKHLDITFEVMYHQLLQTPSPILDSTIYNFLLNTVDAERWCNNRSIAVLSGLKKIAQANDSRRFDTPFWSKCMVEIKASGLEKRNDKETEGLIAEKNLKCEFGYHIWLQAVLHGTVVEACEVQFVNLTCQRIIDYDNFQPKDGKLDYSKKCFRALWKWGKTRSARHNFQYTYNPFGRHGSFYDMETCWKTLLKNWPPNNTYLFNYKTRQGKIIKLQNVIKKFACMVPVQFQSFPAHEISIYYFKNMMTDFLARTKNLHPQIGGHYLKHTLQKDKFMLYAHENFGQAAHMWFSQISMRYSLKVSHLPEIKAEFQRIWDDICFKQNSLLKKLWKKMGLMEFDNFVQTKKLQEVAKQNKQNGMTKA